MEEHSAVKINELGPVVQWVEMLAAVLAFHGAPVWIPDAPLSTQLTVMCLRKQQMMAQGHEPLHQYGKSKWISWLLNSVWPSPGHMAIWGVNQWKVALSPSCPLALSSVSGRSLPSPHPFLHPSAVLQINNLKKRMNCWYHSFHNFQWTLLNKTQQNFKLYV